MSFDSATGRTWLCYLHVDLEVREAVTPRGGTRVTDSADRIVVKSRAGRARRFGRGVDLGGNLPHAVLAPAISAAGGRACAAWCGCHPETGRWSVFAAYSPDGKKWGEPVAVAGGARPALNPSVALDPDTGAAWIAYEDWGDGSVRLSRFDGGAWSRPEKISGGGRNFRPKAIVTAAEGKHRGAAAVAWDSYRGGQYDIYMSLAGSGGRPGDEIRVTRCGSWDSCADIAEDLDGNLWIAWTRASSEHGDTNAMRDIHVKFFDGADWRYPSVPGFKYSAAWLDRAIAVTGRKPAGRRAREKCRDKRRDGNGRITWYTVNRSPRLGVDGRNRVYVFYIGCDPAYPPILARLKYRVYSGDRWSRPRRLPRGPDGAMASLRDYSVVLAGRSIEGAWERAKLNTSGEVLSIRRTVPVPVVNRTGRRYRVKGEKYPEKVFPGWKKAPVTGRRPTVVIGGEKHSLLFGDMHAHSSISIGVDPPDFSYHFARDIARLDFFALSENDCLFCGTPGTEALIAFLPGVFSSGDFTCFPAHEFVSSAMGHRVMVFEHGGDVRMFPSGMLNSIRSEMANTTEQLYNFLAGGENTPGAGPGGRVMVWPHNMINLGNDFSSFDGDLEPVYDVASLHYPAERRFDEYRDTGGARGANRILELMISLSRIPSGGRKKSGGGGWRYSFRECLDAGFRPGASGSSDSHTCNSVGRVATGAWCAGSGRKEILDACFQRRTFACDSGLRMTEVLDTDPYTGGGREDHPYARFDARVYAGRGFMGSETSPVSAPLIRVEVSAPDAGGPVDEIVIVKDGREVHKAAPGGSAATVRWRDEDWKPGKHYYYARIRTRGGASCYTSPVFTV